MIRGKNNLILITLLILIGGVLMITNSYSASNYKEININLNKRTGRVKHGAIGGLYALSEPNIPSLNVLIPLKITTIAQKAPGGLQHPGGDALRVAETFSKAGGKYIQIYLQDVYANWPYEKGIDNDKDGIPDDYLEKVKKIVLEVYKSPYKSIVAYVPFNEPDYIWFNHDLIWYGISSSSTYLKAWKKIYDVIKAIDPSARIVGPNLASYRSYFINSFLSFCKENKCLPDIISWHELNTSFFDVWDEHYNDYRDNEKALGISPKPVVINEYGTFSDLSVPGRLIQWISRFENSKVDACLAYWHVAGNFDDLVVDNNSPNGAWWLYKWYADMNGETVETNIPNQKGIGLSAIASIDENKSIFWCLFGGEDTNLKIKINNISKKIFGDKVYVKIYMTDWSGYEGIMSKPIVLKEEINKVNNEELEITLQNLKKTAAYFMIVSRTTKDKIIEKSSFWNFEYEAENANLVNCEVFSDGTDRDANNNFYSNNKGVLLKNSNSYIIFDNIEVPQNGTYLIEIYYSNGNRAITEGYIKIDNGEYEKLLFYPSINWRFVGKLSKYVYLNAGKHTMIIARTDGKNVSEFPLDIDKITISFINSENVEEDINPQIYEAEEARLDDGLNLYYPRSCSGASVVLGVNSKKAIKFIISTNEDGYYKIKIAYATPNVIEMSIKLNNKVGKVLSLPPTRDLDNFLIGEQAIFFEKGINILEIKGNNETEFGIDYIEVIRTHEFDSLMREIEAESENNIFKGNIKKVNSKYASKGAYITGIGKGKDNILEIETPELKRGLYTIVIYYANGEILGSHPYNVNLVDRFSIVEINEEKIEEVYFRNTNGFEAFKTIAIYSELKEGRNILKFYNPNLIISTAYPSPWGPDIDKILIAPTFIE